MSERQQDGAGSRPRDCLESSPDFELAARPAAQSSSAGHRSKGRDDQDPGACKGGPWILG